MKNVISRKQGLSPCIACFRPCEEPGDVYCKECIKSGAAVWHTGMVAQWRQEVEDKEAS